MPPVKSTSALLSPDAQLTRERILDAARSCFAERGYAGTSLRWVADNAGVTQPLVSHYFGTKERLFEAVLERSVADYEVAQAEQFARELNDPEFFVVGLLVLFRWLKDQGEVMRLAQWARLEGRWPSPDGTMEIWRQLQARAGTLMARGVLREDLDIDSALVMVDALTKGYWDRRAGYEKLYEAMDEDPNALDRICERTFLVSMVRAFFTPEHQPAAEARLDELLKERAQPASR